MKIVKPLHILPRVEGKLLYHFLKDKWSDFFKVIEFRVEVDEQELELLLPLDGEVRKFFKIKRKK